MILLVDFGNTSVKWALASTNRLETVDRFVHRGHDLEPLLERSWGGFAAPARVVVSSVAGGARTARLGAWIRHAWRLRPEFIRAGRQAAGVTCGYARPETFGADRWAALIAAWRATGSAVCVVDCGTAITLDLVDATGRHLGGQIIAGVTMMRQALSSQTANLRLPPASQAPVLLATSTAEAINSGSLYAAVAAVERVTGDITVDTGLRPAIMITGGDAPVLLPLLRLAASHDADLVLKGIAILAGET